MSNQLIGFRFGEGLKSMLIVASNLIQYLETMEMQEKSGAAKLLIAYLNQVANEARLAYNASKNQEFQHLEHEILQAISLIQGGSYSGVLSQISKCISRATTIAQSCLTKLI